MIIALLGRQPELSLAELAAVFGAAQVRHLGSTCAEVATDDFPIDSLGGTLTCGSIVHRLPASGTDQACLAAASRYITTHYAAQWHAQPAKLTLGISAHGLDVSPRAVQAIGLRLKTTLKKSSVSLRLIPNQTAALSTATAHHNKLGRSPRRIELLIIRAGRQLIIAESRGTQNISAYAFRDRRRPRRDAFVGMLPPKLAQLMINLALGPRALASNDSPCVLDPFCGTGTVLQEALLKGCAVLGSDLNHKMIDYTVENLDWLQATHRPAGQVLEVKQGDAMTTQWPTTPPIDAVVCETYLGQPFSAPPRPEKLAEVVGNCNHIITEFLRNLHPQLRPGTPLCIAVPAWADTARRFTHLPLIRQLEKLGYQLTQPQPLIYHRPGQVVARQLLVLRRR